MGWLWTDFHYFHKYLHNDELNSKFHNRISKYYVRATHTIYTQLQPKGIFWYIVCWTLSKVTPVFGVTLDMQCIHVILSIGLHVQYLFFQGNFASGGPNLTLLLGKFGMHVGLLEIWIFLWFYLKWRVFTIWNYNWNHIICSIKVLKILWFWILIHFTCTCQP